MSTRYPVRLMTMVFLAAVMILTSQAIAGQAGSDLSGQIRSLEFSKSVPGELNYQGHLANVSDSTAVTATLEMTFRLFDTETKGAELWSETHPAVEVQGGLFQALLGSVTAFPDGLFDGSGMWLQTEVGTEVLSPRKPLVSVAYSHRTNSAEMLEDNTLTDLDQRWVNADDLDHLNASDGNPLNAVYVDGSGRVGIGTTSPVHPLDVDGTVNATAFIGDGSGLTGVSGTADADWTIDGNDVYHQTGNVGIGTTSPSYPLDVSGAARATTFYGDGSNLTGISGSADADWTINGDTVYHEVGPVGIGTTSPTALLTIQGGSGDEIFFPGASNNIEIKSTMSMRIGTISGHGVGLLTNNLYRMLVNGDGDVGIGTISPQQKLHIHDGAKGLCYTQYTNSSTGEGSDDGLRVGINSSGHGFVDLRETDKDLTLGTNAAPRVIVKSTGEVGIGTSIPAYMLEVAGAVSASTFHGDGSNLTGISGTTDADWTISSNNMYSAVSGNVGIGTTGPGAKLHVVGSSGHYAQLGRADRAVYGVNPGANYGHLAGSYGAFGADLSNGNFGYLGGSRGVYGEHDASGNYGYLGNASYGAYGYNTTGNFGYIAGSAYGVYGKHGSTNNSGYLGGTSHGASASHGDAGHYCNLATDMVAAHGYNDSSGAYGQLGTNDYGVYYSGGISGTGKGGLIVRTNDGPREVCFHQATESWCEDFGSGVIFGGRAEIQLADDFRQTVTVSAIHPLKVFITPNQRIGEWWVEKNSDGFVLVAPDAPDGAGFDFRVVAKQRGYENERLIFAPAGYGDHFLYPDMADVPLEYRAKWRSSAPDNGTE